MRKMLEQDWLGALILVLAVVLVYQPVWSAGYIWDDAEHVTANPVVVGPLGLKEIWTTPAGKFFPLVLTTFWMGHALWGVAPLPYHLLNVFLHGACAVVLWRVLLGLRTPGAWLGAALWALHPVQVESVAWISEMKNTQSGLFYLLTILFFVRWLRTAPQEKGRESTYALTLLFAAMAMASKSSTVVLPLVLTLCAWWVEARWPWRHLQRLVPFFLMAAISSAITLWPGTRDAALLAASPLQRSWPEQLATAGDVIWFYLGKLVWPHPLMAIYPRWDIDAGQWFSFLPLLAAMVLFIGLWLKRESALRGCFFAFCYFLVVLSPFLGLINQSFWRYSFVQDHLQYLASMGPLALVGAGIVHGLGLVAPGRFWLRSIPGAGLLLVLGWLSWQRACVYENEETLWSDNLAKNPDCWVAYNNLGRALDQKGQVVEAQALFQKALVINPEYAEAYNNLGITLAEQGQLDQAMAQFEASLKIYPDFAEAHYDLARAFFLKGQWDATIDECRKALAINPYFSDAQNNLGVAYLRKGQVEQAIEQFKETLRLNPSYTNARENLNQAQALEKGAMNP